MVNQKEPEAPPSLEEQTEESTELVGEEPTDAGDSSAEVTSQEVTPQNDAGGE